MPTPVLPVFRDIDNDLVAVPPPPLPPNPRSHWHSSFPASGQHASQLLTNTRSSSSSFTTSNLTSSGSIISPELAFSTSLSPTPASHSCPGQSSDTSSIAHHYHHFSDRAGASDITSANRLLGPRLLPSGSLSIVIVGGGTRCPTAAIMRV